VHSDQVIWLVGWAYVLANTGRVLSYLPQIATVWRCRDGAKSLSLLTWSYWAFSHLTACLYAGIAVQDNKLLAVSLGNLVCCSTVVVLTTLCRRRLQREKANAFHARPFGAAMRPIDARTRWS
jgi:uncharacterized protein with PQ loop repeat